MVFRSPQLTAYAHSRPVVPCAQCSTTLFAPEWSEYVSASRVRHLWTCDSCGYTFETLVCFPDSGEEEDTVPDAA
jgi:hypothetical protein